MDDAFIVQVGNVQGDQVVVEHWNSDSTLSDEETPSDFDKLTDHGARLYTDTDGKIYLQILRDEIFADGKMADFMKFVTDTVIDELFDMAEDVSKIDTVIISGHGSRWPGINENLQRKFPKTTHFYPIPDSEMKNVVVQGAIAKQELRLELEKDDPEIKIGVLTRNERHIIIIDKEETDFLVDLTDSPRFKLVMFNHKTPNPFKDLKSLKKHFYMDISKSFHRSQVTGSDNILYVNTKVDNGIIKILIITDLGEHYDILSLTPKSKDFPASFDCTKIGSVFRPDFENRHAL